MSLIYNARLRQLWLGEHPIIQIVTRDQAYEMGSQIGFWQQRTNVVGAYTSSDNTHSLTISMPGGKEITFNQDDIVRLDLKNGRSCSLEPQAVVTINRTGEDNFHLCYGEDRATTLSTPRGNISLVPNDQGHNYFTPLAISKRVQGIMMHGIWVGDDQREAYIHVGPVTNIHFRDARETAIHPSHVLSPTSGTAPGVMGVVSRLTSSFAQTQPDHPSHRPFKIGELSHSRLLSALRRGFKFLPRGAE